MTTRRNLLKGLAAAPVAAAPALPALAGETPVQRVDRLSRALSAALNDYSDGQFFAEIWPSDHEEWPLRYIVRRARTDVPNPDAELLELGRKWEAVQADRRHFYEHIAPRLDRGGKVDECNALDMELAGRSLELVEAIAGIPATTVAGLYVKARPMVTPFVDDCSLLEADDPERGSDGRLMAGIIRDLRAMLEEPPCA